MSLSTTNLSGAELERTGNPTTGSLFDSPFIDAPSRAPFPSEGGHWYDKNGEPRFTITGKNGKERPPQTKEAIALGYVPGSTTIIGQIKSWGLENYGKRQAIESALTMPRLPGESDKAYIDRILQESDEHKNIASERGKELHAAIDSYVMGQPFAVNYGPHITTILQTLRQHGIDITKGKAQVTFATDTYGGMVDWVSDEAIIDWKTKDTLTGKKKLAYPSHCQQLASYSDGLTPYGRPKRRLLNVFIGVDDGAVRVHEWDQKEIENEGEIFQLLVKHWWLRQKS